MATTVAHQTTQKAEKAEQLAPSKRPRADTFSIGNEMVKMLMSTKVEQLHPPSGIIYICKREDKIVDVWKGLNKYGFWSCPVIQKTKNKWYGFVDLMDILHTVIETFGQQQLQTDTDFWEANAKDEIFQKKTVGEVMQYPLSRRNPFHPVAKGYSLWTAIEVLAREPGCHRIPVIDQNRNLVNMITQTQIIDWLVRNMDKMGPLKDKPLSTIPSSHSTVVRVHQDEIALEAFKEMRYKNISGVAVVDDDGKLVGAISQTDLKLIQPDGRMFWRLYQTVKNFLLKNRKEGWERPSHPIVAEPTDTIGSTLEKFHKFHVHRIFVVDDHKKPIGIVCLTDILSEVVNVDRIM